jgi:hypothetical protein
MFEALFGGLALVALTTLELFLAGAFLLALVVGVTYDRRGVARYKWYVVAAGLVALVACVWSDGGLAGLTWEGALAAATSSALWVPVAWYAGLGLAYSVVEFLLSLRRSNRRHGAAWAAFMASSPSQAGTGFDTVGRLLAAAADPEATDDVQRAAKYEIDRFVDRDGDPLFALERKGLAIDTSVNRGNLAGFVGVWVPMWPAYAISMVLGDLLTELGRAVADAIANMSGRLVRRVYADTFTIKA